MKKILSFVLCFTMVVSAFATVTMSSQAKDISVAVNGSDIELSDSGYTLLSESQFNSKVNELKSLYPEHSYPDYTYYENGTALAWTCHGFANKLAYYCFGSSMYTWGGGWNKSWDSSYFNAGDIVRVDDDGHTIFIIYVNGNTIRYAEGNYDGYVRWDVETSLSDLQNRFTYKVHLEGNNLTGSGKSIPKNPWIKASHTLLPTDTNISFTFGADGATYYDIGIDKNNVRIITERVTSGKTYSFNEEGNYTAYVSCANSSGYVDSPKVYFTVFEPVVIGTDFTAYITNSKASMNISATNDKNVILENKTDSDNQKWHFILQKDNSYKIVNIGMNECMDVYGAKTDIGTNIDVFQSNDTNAQRFYLRINSNGGYSLIPKCNLNAAIDITNGALVSGNNIQECTWNDTNAQGFSIDYLDLSPSKVEYNNGHTYEYYDIGMPWNQAYRFCESKGGHLVTITSSEENSFVYNMARDLKKYCWLGGTQKSSSGGYYWITGERFGYTNWETGQPDNFGKIENYLHMHLTGTAASQWNDVKLHGVAFCKNSGFICEYDSIETDTYSPVSTVKLNDVTYEVFDEAVDWQTAEMICKAKGGHLVKIDNSEENEVISQVAAKGNKEVYWINATDRYSEGIWKDVDGNNLTYTNWAEGNPKNSFNVEQYAGYTKSNKTWSDFAGFSASYSSFGFICEYSPEAKILLGDADGDGMVTPVDVTMIQRALSQLDVNVNETTLMNGDVEGNGVLEVTDATCIQRYLAGLEIPYPIGS